MEITINSGNKEEKHISATAKVHVTKDGMFTGMLSEMMVKRIESYHIELESNRLGKKGYFVSDTLKGLYDKIQKVLDQCVTYKVIEEKPVIRYYINTACNYVLGKHGEIYPNGYYTENLEEFKTNWKSGTKKFSCTNGGDYGFSFWVCPYMKKTIQYGDGEKKCIYERFHDKNGIFMKWLEDMNQVQDYESEISFEKQKEIDGTEKNAEFFVNLMKSLCRLNENIKSVLNNSDNLQKLIDSNINLLS